MCIRDSMVAERFEHSDVTEAPDSAILSRFRCPEPFGKTTKSSFNAGQRSLLWLFNVSHTQTYGSAEFSRPVAFPLRRTLREDSEIQFYCRRMISFMIVERFAHAHVTAAPDSAARSRFYCSEPFGKTHKSSFIAGQRSLLWLFDVSHTQT